MASVVGSQILWDAAGRDVPWFNVSKNGASVLDIPARDHSMLTGIGANTHATLDNFVTAISALLNPNSGSLTLNSNQQKIGNFTGLLYGTGGWLSSVAPDGISITDVGAVLSAVGSYTPITTVLIANLTIAAGYIAAYWGNLDDGGFIIDMGAGSILSMEGT